MKEGHIFTDGPIDNNYPAFLKEQLARIGNVDVIVHHLSSPGGSVYAGYEAFHALRSLGKKIKTIVEGQCQSIATFIALAGDEVEILNPSRWMIHNPKFMSPGSADADMLQGGADELRKIENEMAEVYAAKSKKTVDEIKAMMKRETYMTAQEAVDYGFADKKIDFVNKKEYEQLKAVALGTAMEEKTLIEKAKTLISDALRTLVPPKALDLNLKDGGTVNVATEDDVLLGKPVTVNGKPAEGTYMLEDGRTLVCEAGVVKEVKEVPAAPPAPSPEEAMKKEIEQLKAQLQTAQTQVTTAEKQSTVVTEAAKQEKEKVATALSEAQKQIEELQKMTIGDQSRPQEAMAFSKFGTMNTTQQQLSTKITRSFLADNMPWLERHYPGGKYKDGTRFMDYREGGPDAVSILETNLGYTYPGILSTDIFYKPTIGSPALSELFTIDPGSKDSKRYNLSPVMNKVVKPYTGCDQAVTGSTYDITSKKIQLKPFQVYESFCKDDFTNQLTGAFNILAEEWLKSGNESFDPAGTPIDRMIVDLLKDAIRRDLIRRTSFGDTTSASADWNQIDGYWQALIDQSGASNYCVYRAGSALGIGALGAGDAIAHLATIYNNSTNLLKDYAIDGKRGRFLVTRSIWENYYTSLAAVGAVTEQAYTAAVKGISNLTFRGIPVIPVTLWDDQLADATNPLSATTRHLISFTVKDNHILGVENMSDLDKIDSWFEKKDNKRYYRVNMTMGFLGPLHCELTTIMY